MQNVSGNYFLLFWISARNLLNGGHGTSSQKKSSNKNVLYMVRRGITWTFQKIIYKCT